MDTYAAIRSVSFPVLASALGINLERYKVRKGGQEWYGACPVHNPKNNMTSFSYNADGRFYCFSAGCGIKGRGALDLVKLVKGCGFQDAVAFLAPFNGTNPHLDTKKAPEASSDATEGILKPLERDSWRKFAGPCPWLEARCPDAGIRERYGIFMYNNPARKSAYSGRVMIPVKDSDNQLYGYLGRYVPSPDNQPNHDRDTAKYLFPKNLPKSKFCFGAAELKAGMFGQVPLKVVYLVESPFCCLRFAMYGLPAVSPFGWSVSEHQLKILQQLARGAIYLPDRNKYQDCAPTVRQLGARIWVRCPELPEGCEDPEHLSLDQILAL